MAKSVFEKSVCWKRTYFFNGNPPTLPTLSPVPLVLVPIVHYCWLQGGRGPRWRLPTQKPIIIIIVRYLIQNKRKRTFNNGFGVCLVLDDVERSEEEEGPAEHTDKAGDKEGVLQTDVLISDRGSSGSHPLSHHRIGYLARKIVQRTETHVVRKQHQWM